MFLSGSDQPVDIFVGDTSAYTLHNLQPGTTYDVKVIAQYTSGMSGPLDGQGTTRTYSHGGGGEKVLMVFSFTPRGHR